MPSFGSDVFSNKLVVFDFDGVLVDSIEIKTDAFAELYKAYGDPIVSKVVEHHRSNGGISRFEKFRHYHEKFVGVSITENEILDLSRQFSFIVLEKVIAAQVIAGAIEFIDLCKTRGIECAINSATPEDEINEIISRKKWGELFTYVLGSPSGKSDNLHKIMNSSGVTANETIFFGDAESDLHAANENSVDFVGIGPWMVEKFGNKCLFPVHINFLGLI